MILNLILIILKIVIINSFFVKSSSNFQFFYSLIKLENNSKSKLEFFILNFSDKNEISLSNMYIISKSQLEAILNIISNITSLYSLFLIILKNIYKLIN